MGIILAIFVFSFIVFIHELGHFLLAKKNHIRVSEFSIGMGPRILSKEIGETRYSIKAFPLGGSCMMGEDDVEDQSEGSFNSKSVGARFAVIVAGPLFNFILAFLLAIVLRSVVGIDLPIIGSVIPGSPAEEMGLEAGDKITHLDNERVYVYRGVLQFVGLHPGSVVDIRFERDGEEHQVQIEPKFFEEEGRYLLGITPSANTKGNLLENIKYGAYEVVFGITSNLKGMSMLFTGQASVEEMSGPVGIAGMINEAYEESKPAGIGVITLTMINLIILFSSALGVMNLLPIPALDGGRICFLLVEKIRGRRLPAEKEGIVHLIGFVLLIMLMIVVMFNDIKKLFM